MSFLPDMTQDSDVFIDGLTRANAGVITRVKRAKPSARLADLIQPPEERAVPDTREYTFLNEDEELLQWERVTRVFIHELACTRAHRVTPDMIWAYATGITDADKNTTDYRRDMRRIRKVLRDYFGPSYQSTIRGVKCKEVFRVRRGFLVYRKAPISMTLYLEWKKGLRTH
jgi:hypothetical protein